MAADDEAAPSPRPGSSAALEARVARLERQYDNMASTVNAMAIDVGVTRAKLESVETSIGSLSASIEKAMTIIQASIADASSTPAGKAIQSAMIERRRESEGVHAAIIADVKTTTEEIGKLKLWVATASGALIVVVFIVNLITPSIRAALGM